MVLDGWIYSDIRLLSSNAITRRLRRLGAGSARVGPAHPSGPENREYLLPKPNGIRVLPAEPCDGLHQPLFELEVRPAAFTSRQMLVDVPDQFGTGPAVQIFPEGAHHRRAV